MEFEILGPVRVVTESGVRPLGGAKARTVLALLVVRANHTVSTDALIDALWGEHPPRSAVTTLQTYVYQLRKHAGIDAIVTRPTGYALDVAREAVDALRFEDAVRTAPDRAPGDAAAALAAALAAWRGPALAEVRDASWAQADAIRLDTLRLDAIEQLIDARLALGDHRALVAELESLVGDHPLRERFSAQLMLALYRCNRQAEALRACARLRSHLRDELGVDPSPHITELETAILNHAPELAPPAPPRTATAEMRRRRLPVLLLVGASVVLAAGGFGLFHDRRTRDTFAGPAGYEPSYHATTCPPEISNGDATAQCGVLRVPEDRQQPHGRQIELGVFRFPTNVGHPAPDPVVQIGSTFRLAEPPGDATLRTRGDSIYLAGRGFYGSNPRLTCPNVEGAVRAALARPLRDPLNTTQFVDAAARCRGRWRARGVNLDAYSATARADDVRDLAIVLHLHQVNLVAAGPSANDAREVAARYPNLIRSVTLVNVTPTGPDANRWNGAISGAAAALDRFIGECTNDERCNRTYPDLRQRLIATFNRLERKPVTFTVADPYKPAHGRLPVRIDGDRAMELLMQALETPDAAQLVPEAITSPTSGPVVAEFAADHLIEPYDASWGALLSRVCIDEIASVGVGGLNLEAQADPLLAFMADDPLLEVCGAWRTPPTQTVALAPVGTPTLVLEGELDPFTAHDWAQNVAQDFGHATVVELPHLGQVATSGNDCVLGLRAEFLANPLRPLPADVCARELPPLHFVGTSTP